MSSNDMAVMDRYVQRFVREGTSMFIRTYDGTVLVHEHECMNVGQTIPNEVNDIARTMIAQLALGLIGLEINPDTGGIEIPGAVAGRSAAQLAAAPTTADIALGDSTIFYDIADPTKRFSMAAGHASFSALGGGSSYPAVTVEHLPASTALIATTTPGGIVSRFGFSKQIALAVAQAGGSGIAGDIQIAWTNDGGVTFTAYSTIGALTAGGTTSIVIPMADALGIAFRVRLANVTGTLTGATVGITAALS